MALMSVLTFYDKMGKYERVSKCSIFQSTRMLKRTFIYHNLSLKSIKYSIKTLGKNKSNFSICDWATVFNKYTIVIAIVYPISMFLTQDSAFSAVFTVNLS